MTIKKAGLIFKSDHNKLNQDQAFVLEIVLEKIDSQEGGLIFIDASGGVGKTRILNMLASTVQKEGKRTVVQSRGRIRVT